MRLLSYRQLREEKGIRFCRTHLRRLMFDPKYAHVGFPKAVQVSTGRIGWYEHEIDAWLKALPRLDLSTMPVEEEQDDLRDEFTEELYDLAPASKARH